MKTANAWGFHDHLEKACFLQFKTITTSSKEFVASNYLRKFQKYNYSPGDAPYDVTSIMHYDGKLRGHFQTPIMTNKRTGNSIGVNREMSSMDIQKLNKMYPCKQADPPCGRFLHFVFYLLIDQFKKFSINSGNAR